MGNSISLKVQQRRRLYKEKTYALQMTSVDYEFVSQNKLITLWTILNSRGQKCICVSEVHQCMHLILCKWIYKSTYSIVHYKSQNLGPPPPPPVPTHLKSLMLHIRTLAKHNLCWSACFLHCYNHLHHSLHCSHRSQTHTAMFCLWCFTFD